MVSRTCVIDVSRRYDHQMMITHFRLVSTSPFLKRKDKQEAEKMCVGNCMSDFDDFNVETTSQEQPQELSVDLPAVGRPVILKCNLNPVCRIFHFVENATFCTVSINPQY